MHGHIPRYVMLGFVFSAIVSCNGEKEHGSVSSIRNTNSSVIQASPARTAATSGAHRDAPTGATAVQWEAGQDVNSAPTNSDPEFQFTLIIP